MTRRNVLKGAKLNLCHAALAVAVTTCLAPIAAHAQSMETQATFNIPAGDLSSAVDAFSRQSGLQILYRPELLGGKKATPISGPLTNGAALERLLKGSGIRWERVNGSTYVLKDLKKAEKDEPVASPPISNPTKSKRAEEVDDLEKIIVVGSRLGTSPVESAMPIKVITREDIDRSGGGNIAQVLSYLSEVSNNNNGDRNIGVGDGIASGGNTNSSTIQMRGMPRGTTLILINGRRAGDSASYSDTGQFDLSTIPLSLVERIEVLPAGSSAVYGGDGLAGVINVVLRRDANGIELRLRTSHADGYETNQASAIFGKAWAEGNLTIAVSWRKEGALTNDERELTRDWDYRRFGGRDLRGAASNPGNVYSLAGCPAPPGGCYTSVGSRANLPGLNSAYATIPAESDGVGLTPADFASTQGVLNRSTGTFHLRSAEENVGLVLNAAQKLSSSIEGFTELTYSERKVPAYQLPLTLSSGEYGLPHARVSASNPFNPFGVDVGIDFSFRNTGLYTSYRQNHLRGLLGFRGKISRFDWELAGWQAKDESESTGPTSLNVQRIAEALSSTDPATALNPFVSDGTAPGSSALLASLVNPLNRTSESKTTGLTGYIRGNVVELPSGAVTGLIGFERQKLDFKSDTNSTSVLVPHVDGDSTSEASFAEIRVPVISPRPGEAWERLAVTGALRRESNDRMEGAATTETMGLEFRPFESILIRGTYSTAFRPLLAYFSVQDALYEMQYIYDPRISVDEYFEVPVRIRGGKPDGLNPESSNNSTVGFVYRPSQNWSLSVTHWDMEFTDRISFIPVQTIVDNEQYYPGRVTRDPTTGAIVGVDSRQVNIAFFSAAGIDIGFDAGWSTAVGDFQANLSATYTYEHEEQLAEEIPAESGLAKIRTGGWAPRWKIVPRLSWDNQQGMRAGVTGRYISKYRDTVALTNGPRAGEFKTLGGDWIFDLNVELELSKYVQRNWLSGASLSIGATNLFDRNPEFCATCSTRGYDASQYDIVGRSIYAEIRKAF